MTGPAEPTVQEVVDSLRGDIAKFSEAVTKLANTVVDNVDQVARYGRRTRRMTRVIAVSVAVDILLSVVLTLVGARLHTVQTHQSETQTALARVEQTTSTEVLCPLYGLIVSGYHPELRPAGPARVEYVKDYMIILRGYRALGCAPPVPTPHPGPSPSGH